MSAEVVLDDCVEYMNSMPECSVDSVVCDPPYGLGKAPDIVRLLTDWLAEGDHRSDVGGFMGKKWDAIVPGPRYWRAAYRVLKPGGHLLAFGGTRTYDMLVIALRLSGFEIRDQIQWLYGSGFPKSHNVSKAIDKAAGATREVLSDGAPFGRGSMGNRSRVEAGYRPTELNPNGGIAQATAPATAEALRWEGWGTGLKPANEPIVLARKPLTERNVAANVLANGTGALNVGACMIGTTKDVPASVSRGQNGSSLSGSVDGSLRREIGSEGGHDPNIGRWPANVIFDPEAAVMLDAQTGVLKSGDGTARRASGADNNGNTSSAYGAESRPSGSVMVSYGDSGGASRFFYVAKPSNREKQAGLEGFGLLPSGATSENLGQRITRRDGGAPGEKANNHTTVKPIKLMRYLCRLVTPPGGLVLDPFAGSGTTGCAARLEGFRFLGIEQGDPVGDPRLVEVARARISHWDPIDYEVFR